MAPIRGLVTGLIASLLLIHTPFALADEPSFATAMPDGAYRECVTQKLGLGAGGEPSEAQLASIVELSCTGRGITDATGTALMPNLTKLFLGNNALTTVRPLAQSSKIFSLGLANNALTDIAELASLTQLSNLDIAGNRLRDVSVLGTFPKAPLSGTRHGQQATGNAATATEPTLAPRLVGRDGNAFAATPPDGLTVAGEAVTYPAAGTYTWTFRDQQDFSFNGTVTVEVRAASASPLPDEALKGCVNARLARPADSEPSADELSALTGSLTCNGKGVRDLSGVGLLSGLTTLSLNDNEISDVSALANHPSLVTLNLKGNTISDLTGLTTLPRLKTLDLTLNDVTSLSTLGANSTIYTLRVGQTASSTRSRLVSLDGVQRLTGLGVLNINHTAVTSLAPLADHPALRTLDAESSKLTDLGPLESITTLNLVRVSNNQISDISPLAALSSSSISAAGQTLEAAPTTAQTPTAAPRVTGRDGTVHIATPPSGITATDGTVVYDAAGSYTWTFEIRNYSWESPYYSGTIVQEVGDAPKPVVGVEIPDPGLRDCLAEAVGVTGDDPITDSQLAALTEVSCVAKGITDLTGAEHLSGTTSLILSSNQITDVTPLSGLTGLERLLLPGNAIADVAPLADLTALSVLSLGRNPVGSIAALAPLTAMTDLEVTQRARHDHADLSSLTGVEAMTGLQRLVVNNSSLTDLTPVANLSELTRLYVSGNSISDLSPLKGLTKLTHLGINSNEIASVAPLASLTALESLDLASNRIHDLSPLNGMPHQAYMGLKARWQDAEVPAVGAELEVSVPRVLDYDGALVAVEPPSGITVDGLKVTYPEPGRYTWTFSARTGLGEHFSGTVTQPVGDPVADPANIPDPGLRDCVAIAAGLAPGSTPTTADAETITELACRDAGVLDLTGLELLSNVTALDLAGNPLPGLGEIAALIHLEELDLSRTGLASLTGLRPAPGLTTLRVDGNMLMSLAGAPAGLELLSAVDQRVALPQSPGDVLVPIPTLVGTDGSRFSAVAPTMAEPADGGVVFPVAGEYLWTFASDDATFTGVLSQFVTSDRVDPHVNDPAASCVAAGNVWVTIERDTGLRDGGCATEFGTGLEALASAGFSTTMSGSLLTAIDGYPGSYSTGHYWSYWQGEPTGNAVEYPWSYASMGPAEHAPRPGSVEGWRYVEWVPGQDAPAPSWTLSVKSAPDPTPDPTPEPTPTPTVQPEPVNPPSPALPDGTGTPRPGLPSTGR